jgi:hypothetical protein
VVVEGQHGNGVAFGYEDFEFGAVGFESGNEAPDVLEVVVGDVEAPQLRGDGEDSLESLVCDSVVREGE